jgi:superfamily II DNA helicase RecQ
MYVYVRTVFISEFGQLPALIRQGITLVISPLISLIRDQVNQLNQCVAGTFTLRNAPQQ